MVVPPPPVGVRGAYFDDCNLDPPIRTRGCMVFFDNFTAFT